MTLDDNVRELHIEAPLKMVFELSNKNVQNETFLLSNKFSTRLKENTFGNLANRYINYVVS